MPGMAENMEPEKRTPMPLFKAVGILLLLYALIGGSAVWKLRRNCLLQQDDCNHWDLSEWVLSDRISLIASALILAVLLQITWHFVGLMRHGIPTGDKDKPKRRFKAGGLAVAIVVNIFYVAIALGIQLSAIGDLHSVDESNLDLLMWRMIGPILGALFVFSILVHVNDYFVKPAPLVALFLLFIANIGTIYYAGKSVLLTI